MRLVFPALTLALALAIACRAAPVPAWWRPDWAYRVPVQVRAALGEAVDTPTQVRLNFGALVREGQRFAPASVRVVEHDAKSGAVVAEVPALFQPVDNHWPGLVPLSWHEPYDEKTPPRIRASSSNPAFPVASLVSSGPGWEPADPTPPWLVAVDLGDVRTISAVFVRLAYNGYGLGLPSQASVEVTTDSPDGLREGTWQAVGGWQGLNGFYLNGFTRPIFFAPCQARYVRIVLGATNRDVPRLAQFSVYAPFWDPVARAEGRVSWTAPGRTTDTARLFYVYFDDERPVNRPSPPTGPVALLREAEEAVNLFSPPGIPYRQGYDAQASGPANPNLLTYSYEKDIFWPPAGFTVTVPRSDNYAAHLRLRAGLRDHEVRLLWDTQELFKGTFSVEGEGWSIVSLPALPLTEGTHYFEALMRGGDDRPLDLDCILFTQAPGFTPTQWLLATPGRVEVRP